MTWSGFHPFTVDAHGTQLFGVIGGSGPPLLLLHGYPQTHACWARVAPALAERFRVIALDLPGYGRSDAPQEGPERYTKRRMATDVRAAMIRLGYPRFLLAGHDRGARVAYRLALDTPEAVAALAILDIVPTAAVWDTMSVAQGLALYHWFFLAQPAPLPESLIGRDPVDFLDRTLASWTMAKDLSAFSPEALASYRESMGRPQNVAASCMDYRAGATLDWAHDRESADAGHTIAAPVEVLWSTHFKLVGDRGVLDVWRDWADDVDGARIESGHFVCEENPEAVLARLIPFFSGHAHETGERVPPPPPPDPHSHCGHDH